MTASEERVSNDILTVRGFLVIKEARLEIKKINIIIGPQANGKSILAKLAHFFSSLGTIFIEGVINDLGKRQVDALIAENFQRCFPRYAWENNPFEISYITSGFELKVKGEKRKNGKVSLRIEYPTDLNKLLRARTKVYKNKIEEDSVNSRRLRTLAILREVVIEPLCESPFSSLFQRVTFIPASRSFFANLQKNIFTFLASNIELDPYLKEFGSVYGSMKRLYSQKMFSNSTESYQIESLMKKIVAGEYEYKEEQDWLVDKKAKRNINLSNASSGQQEALPMLLTLSVWPRLSENRLCFIEEPEAHLFPVAQSDVVSFLSLLYSDFKTRFFITTHSPYILSAFNNLIMAHDVISAGGYSKEQLKAANGVSSPIRFEDVSAYAMSEGTLESIVDETYRLIGSDLIDSISAKFDNVMDDMLSVEGEV